MPYVIPAMPLSLNVWHNFATGSHAYAAPDVTCACNLTPGRRTFMNLVVRATMLDGIAIMGFSMEVLVPKLTDVRTNTGSLPPDVFECPAGSKRMYLAMYVDDIGKGFANEHRFVIGHMINQSLVFTDTTIVPPITLP